MKLITSKPSVLSYLMRVYTRLPLVLTYLQCEVQYNCHHSSHNPGKKQNKYFKGIYPTLRLTRIFNRMGYSWKEPFKSPDMFPAHCTFLPGQLLSWFQKISKLLIRKKFAHSLIPPNSFSVQYLRCQKFSCLQKAHFTEKQGNYYKEI